MHAIPLVVNVRLYGAASPVRWVDELAADGHGEVAAADLPAPEHELVVGVSGGEVDELVGQLVVVLEPVDQRHGRRRRSRGRGRA